MSKKLDNLEKDCQRAFGETFSLFDAIEKSAERWYGEIENQRIQAVKALNKAIETHNQLEMARAKKAVEFAKKFDELDKAMRDSNEVTQKLYEKCQKTMDILTKRIDEALEDKND